MKTLTLAKVLTDEQTKALKGKYLTNQDIKYDIVDMDCDAIQMKELFYLSLERMYSLKSYVILLGEIIID